MFVAHSGNTQVSGGKMLGACLSARVYNVEVKNTHTMWKNHFTRWAVQASSSWKIICRTHTHTFIVNNNEQTTERKSIGRAHERWFSPHKAMPCSRCAPFTLRDLLAPSFRSLCLCVCGVCGYAFLFSPDFLIYIFCCNRYTRCYMSGIMSKSEKNITRITVL